MNPKDVVDLAKSVDVRCLGYLMLVWLLHGATVSELRLITLGDRHIITDYLKALELRGLVVAAQAGRSLKWYAAEGLQPVGAVSSDPLAPSCDLVDGGIPTINARSSSSCLSSLSESGKQLQLPGDGDFPTIKPPYPPAWQPVYQALRDAGAPDSLAERATVAASGRPYSWPINVEIQIAAWLCYVVSDYGKTIRARGVWIAQQIEAGQRIPDWFRMEEQTGWAACKWRSLRERLEGDDGLTMESTEVDT